MELISCDRNLLFRRVNSFNVDFFLAAEIDSFPNLRIIGGHDAQPGQFPYQVSLQICILGSLCSHSCGGSIISPNQILTAAHCYQGGSFYSYRVIAGVTKLSDNSAGRQVVNVQSWAIHPQYVDNG